MIVDGPPPCRRSVRSAERARWPWRGYRRSTFNPPLPLTLNVILTHQSPACVAAMLGWWRQSLDLDDVLIAAGGRREDFEGIAHPQKVFIDDPRLRTVDHQREFQSYTGAYRTISAWLQGRDYTHIHFCEFDHLPLATDLNARQLARLAAEGADVLGHHVQRIDGTSHPHFLHHASTPAFARFWQEMTCRDDASVVLSMFGSGSFWKREPFEAVAASREPMPIYLELYLPTLAHHLGFRVRDLGEQNSFVRVEPDRTGRHEEARRQGAWSLHPVKHFWDRP